MAVAKKVAQTDEKGILICATGLGIAMVANKIKGIRAAVCWDDFTALQSRQHNDANILCLGGKVIDLETTKKLVRIWLETGFNGEERHVRRLEKIKKIETEVYD